MLLLPQSASSPAVCPRRSSPSATAMASSRLALLAPVRSMVSPARTLLLLRQPPCAPSPASSRCRSQVVLAAACALALSRTATVLAATDLPPITNIVDFQNGYNALTACFLCDATSQQGWRGPIFNISYASGTTYNGAYAVPDNVNVQVVPECSYTQKGAVTVTAYDYLAFLSVQAGLNIGAGYMGDAAFQASVTTGSQFFASRFSSATVETAYLQYVAACLTYAASRPDAASPLDPAFVAAVAALDPDSPLSLNAFVVAYGTHFQQSASFGGIAYYEMSLSIANYTAFLAESAGGNVAVMEQVVYLGFLASIGVDISAYTGYATYTSFLQMNVAVDSVGVPIPVPMDPNQTYSSWTAELALGNSPGPQPVAIQLAPIYSLFTPAYFPNDPDISAKYAAMLNFLTNGSYCSAYASPACTYVTPSAGVVLWFDNNVCPPGWQTYSAAQGVAVLSTANPRLASQTPVGTQLSNGQDPTHEHVASGSYTAPSLSTSMTAGSTNTLMHSGNQEVSGTSGSSGGTGLPFMQLMPCHASCCPCSMPLSIFPTRLRQWPTLTRPSLRSALLAGRPSQSSKDTFWSLATARSWGRAAPGLRSAKFSCTLTPSVPRASPTRRTSSPL